MTFVNLSLLAGTVLVALPIVLHLIMRRKPTLLEFPALRFVRKRHDTNQRSLRLRHLLLLLLRAGAIALLAFALARPSVKLAGGMGSREAPVAAALIFDAAPRMDYRHDNETRLETAKKLGLWLTTQLPEESEIAVLDTRIGAAAAFQADRGAARDRIERLETVSNSQSLPLALDAAAPLLRRSSLPRKEVYLFTDLSRGGWPAEQAARLQQQLHELDDVGVYVVDVGVADPTDCGLSDLRLSGDVLSNRGTLKLSADFFSIGAAAERTVELQVLDASRKPVKKSESICKAIPGQLQPIEFQMRELSPGIHQGSLRIVGQDNLAADDVRYFTVAVKPAWRVLLAAPKPSENYAWFLINALAPAMWVQQGQARFDCDICNLEELAKRSLADYAAVCLLDPTPLEPAAWKKLTEYAIDGHGVAVFLGHNAAPIDSFNSEQAQGLLAGKLTVQVPRPDGDLHLAPRDYQHPILAATGFRDRAGGIPWEFFPVYRYWELDQTPAGTAVVVPFNDGRPAILERSLGSGRALTMTTPVSDWASRNPWNLLLTGNDPWPFLGLANQMITHLVGGGDQQFNYFAGQTAVLQLDAPTQRQSYLLFLPDETTFPIAAELNRRALTIAGTEQVGHYRLRAGGSSGVDLGFSVNYAPEQTQLGRLTDAELAEVFGPVKYRLARTRDQIERDVSLGRVGRELFPPLIVLVALLLAIELLISNRFYREI